MLITVSTVAFLVLWFWLLGKYSQSGVKLFLIQSGSMSPAINIGDLTLVRKQNDYLTGEVIAFKDEDGRVVSHRIFQKLENGEGFITKGDANQSADQNKVPRSKIIGRVELVLPVIGRILPLIRTPVGFSITIILSIILLATGVFKGILRS